MRSETLFAGIVLALFASGQPALAEEDLSKHPGFVDFGFSGLFADEDLSVHVSIKDPLLRLVSEATRDSDPDLSDMVASIKSIEVHVYDVAADRRDLVLRRIGAKADQLQAGGWDPLITVRERDSRSYVFLKRQNNVPVGLAAISVHDDEAVFVNIVGPIDPELIGRLATKFKIEALKDVGANKD